MSDYYKLTVSKLIFRARMEASSYNLDNTNPLCTTCEGLGRMPLGTMHRQFGDPCWDCKTWFEKLLYTYNSVRVGLDATWP